MAVTDDQLHDIKQFARQLGRDQILHDPTDTDIISAALDMAEIEGMRTEDEFHAVISFDDIPAQQDREDIVAAWEDGNRKYAEDMNEEA